MHRIDVGFALFGNHCSAFMGLLTKIMGTKMVLVARSGVTLGRSWKSQRSSVSTGKIPCFL